MSDPPKMKLSPKDEASINLMLWLMGDITRYREYLNEPVVQAWIQAYANEVAYMAMNNCWPDKKEPT